MLKSLPNSSLRMEEQARRWRAAVEDNDEKAAIALFKQGFNQELSYNIDIPNSVLADRMNTAGLFWYNGVYNALPLHVAIWKGWNEFVSIAIKCENIDVDVEDSYGFPPLQIAVYTGNLSIRMKLEGAGANKRNVGYCASRFNDPSSTFFIRLHFDRLQSSFWFQALKTAVKQGYINAARYFLENQPEICDPHCHKSSLFTTASGPEMLQLLDDFGVSANELYSFGISPVKNAIEKGHEADAIFFMENGAAEFEVKAGSTRELNCFHMACLKGMSRLVRLLVEQGIETTVPSNLDYDGFLLIHWYALAGWVAGVKEQISMLSCKALNEPMSRNGTVLDMALSNDKYEVANLLISSGAYRCNLKRYFPVLLEYHPRIQSLLSLEHIQAPGTGEGKYFFSSCRRSLYLLLKTRDNRASNLIPDFSNDEFVALILKLRSLSYYESRSQQREDGGDLNQYVLEQDYVAIASVLEGFNAQDAARAINRNQARMVLMLVKDKSCIPQFTIQKDAFVRSAINEIQAYPEFSEKKNITEYSRLMYFGISINAPTLIEALIHKGVPVDRLQSLNMKDKYNPFDFAAKSSRHSAAAMLLRYDGKTSDAIDLSVKIFIEREIRKNARLLLSNRGNPVKQSDAETGVVNCRSAIDALPSEIQAHIFSFFLPYPISDNESPRLVAKYRESPMENIFIKLHRLIIKLTVGGYASQSKKEEDFISICRQMKAVTNASSGSTFRFELHPDGTPWGKYFEQRKLLKDKKIGEYALDFEAYVNYIQDRSNAGRREKNFIKKLLLKLDPLAMGIQTRVRSPEDAALRLWRIC